MLEIVDALGRCGPFDVIALDSVPGLYSPARQTGARLIVATRRSIGRGCSAMAMRRLAANIDRTRTVVLFSNRLAENAASRVEDMTPGRHALRLYSSVRLGMNRGKLEQSELH